MRFLLAKRNEICSKIRMDFSLRYWSLEVEMARLAAFGLALGVAALGACGGAVDYTIAPPEQLTVTVVAGDHQSANVRHTLSNPLTVSVTNPAGAGVAGVTVVWMVITGGGTLSASSGVTDAQGRASVNWTLGNPAGAQSVTASVASRQNSSTSFSATAAAPIVLHYDGTSWSTALEDVNGAQISLASIWGTSGSSVFAVGGSCSGQVALRYDGSAWGQLPASCQGASWGGYASVWGSSASDVFATLRNTLPMRMGGYLDHFNGQNWNVAVYVVPCGNSIGMLCAGPHGVWSSSPNDAFVVADSGIIAHYDGTSWTSLPSGTRQALAGVWGEGPGGAVFAVGSGGIILRYDRSTWNVQASGTTQSLNAVWGTSSNDVFAVGAGGTILHYDGTSWTSQNSGSTQALYAVWGGEGNSVFAVGDASTILHYDGTKWTTQTTTADMKLRGIWGSSPTNLFAVGEPR
jgi:hypothetical protein